MALRQPLPVGSSLFISTPNTVRIASQQTDQIIFQCETRDGVVCARPAKDNSKLIAVADSHVVLLHDAGENGDRRYILKNSDVRSDSFHIKIAH